MKSSIRMLYYCLCKKIALAAALKEYALHEISTLIILCGSQITFHKVLAIFEEFSRLVGQ